MFRKISLILIACVVAIPVIFLSWWNMHGWNVNRLVSDAKVIEIVSGENVFEVGEKMYQEKVIASPYRFAWQAYWMGDQKKLQAGKYLVRSSDGDRKIIEKMSRGEIIPKSVRVTFPEGWTAKKMSERLSGNGLPGKEFLSLVQGGGSPFIAEAEFSFLKELSKNLPLEGFLFPDTYDFPKDITAENIIRIMLRNFDRRVREAGVDMDGKNMIEVITLASLLESEVKSEGDRKKVADLFLRRIEIGQPLQSCATLQYILGIDRKQYSIEETKIESPYNTYANKGLPPGPVNNPGIVSIRAALSPTPNEFLFFLSDVNTGETIFSRDFEEHKKNKSLHGL